MADRKVVVLWVCAVVFLSVSFGSLTFGGISAATNTEFAVTNADLSDDTVTEGDDVDVTATVENTGDETKTFLAELEVDGEIVQTDEVEIDGGESEEVVFTEEFDEADEYDISISGAGAGTLSVLEPADISVVDASVDDNEISEGEAVEVTADLENTGDETGTFTAELEIDGDTKQTQLVEIKGGETTDVTFTKTFDDAGQYDLSINSEPAGTLSVLEPAELEIVSADLEDDEITESESATVTAEVENIGDETGEFTIGLEANDNVLDEKTIDVAGDTVATVEFTESFEDAGEYDISVNGVSAGRLAVLAPANLEIVSNSLSNTEITEGESATVRTKVENTGDKEGTFTAELEVDGEIERTTSVEVGGGDTEQVELTESFDDAGEYELSVNGELAGMLTVLQPANIVVTSAGLDKTEIDEGDEVRVTATVENTGDEAGEHSVTLSVDGEPVDSRNVDVDSAETETIEFRRTFDDAGEYEIAVNGISAGTLTVLEPAKVSVTSAELDETEVAEGDTVEVSATVENTGDRAGDLTLELIVDGTVVETRALTVGPGETETESFSRKFDKAGDYEIAVRSFPWYPGEDDSRAEAGTVDVLAPADISVVSADLEDDEITEGEEVTVTAEIENTGDETGAFTAELGIDGKEPESETIETDIEGGDTETVQFEEPFDDAGEYGISVNGVGAGTLTVNQSATFETNSANLDPDTILEGSFIEVTATVENTGDEAGEHSANLSIDGDIVDSQDINVGSGETEKVTFSRRFDEAGSYEIAVNGESAGTLKVVKSAKTSIEANISTDEITEGKSIDVTADVENVGEVVGTFTVELQVDGDTVDSEDIFLLPRGTKTVEFNRTFDEAGEYNISVNNKSTETLTILEPANIVVTSAALNETEVSIGEKVRVTAALENLGDKAGTDSVELGIDGSVVDERDVEVGPDERDEITFTRTFDEVGEYDLSVNGTSAGTLTITQFAVVEVILSDDEIEEGESVEVTATVENRGETNGTFEAKFDANGATRDRKNETIAAGEVVTLEFERSFDERGEFALSVSGTDVGILKVEAADVGLGPTGGGGAGGGGGGGGGGGSATAIGGGGGGGGGIGGGGATDGEENSSAEGDGDGEGDTVGNETVVTDDGTSPESTDNAVTISVNNESSDSVNYSVDLTGPSETEPVVSLSAIEIDPGDQEQFRVTITRPTATPSESSPVPRSEVLAYIDLETDPDPNGTTSLHFELNRAELPEEFETKDVQVMRYVDGEWTASGVTHDVNGSNHRATLSRASSIAVVALKPGTIEVVDAGIPADWVRAGSETTASVTVQNTGGQPKTRTLAITMDGETVAKRNVSLDPGETASFELNFEPPGSGEVMLNGTEIGTITVSEEYGSTSAGPETTDEMSGFDLVSIGFALLLVTLIVQVRRS